MRITTGSDSTWLMSDDSYTRLPAWAVTRVGTLRRPVRGALKVMEKLDKRPVPPFHLTVLMTTNCNLGCAYCFQNVAAAEPGSYRPQRIDAKSLNRDTTEDIAAFTRRCMQEAGLTALDLLVFGGEPLLVPSKIFDLLNALKPAGLSRAHMISNAVRLDPGLARRLETAGLSDIQVTFDGQQSDHDKVRHDHRGRGTYRTIVENIVAAQRATGMRFDIRVNVTESNRHGIDGLIEDLGSQLDSRRCSLHLALVDATSAGFSGTTGYEDLAQSYVDWHIAALRQGFSVEPPKVRSRCLYCDQKRAAQGAVVNADGQLYSCWDSAGQVGFDVGNVVDGYYLDNRVEERWVACGYQDHQEPSSESNIIIDRAAAAVLDWRFREGTIDI